MAHVGKSHVCLDIEITRNWKACTLNTSQAQYASKVQQRFAMRNSNFVSTLMRNQIDESTARGTPFPSTTYRQALPSLMHLMICTRSDLSFAVCRLAQGLGNPTEALWVRVKRVLRYLKGSL